MEEITKLINGKFTKKKYEMVPVNRAIKRLFKEGVLSEHEHSKYIRLKNGYYAYVYSLDVVIALSFKFNTYFTHLFRKWLTDKVKEQHPPIFISFPIKDVYGC